METANAEFGEASIGFANIGGTVSRHNNGHHWIIIFTEGKFQRWEWWPSSAKLVAEKQWRKGVHVHNWRDVVNVINEKRTEKR